MKSVCFAIALLFSASSVLAKNGETYSLILRPLEGETFEHVEFACWLPDSNKPIQAVIIHQHGCTNASPDKHPPVTTDFHWQALARKHHCALLVPMYQVAGNCDEWNDPDSGSERALFTALEDFAQQSGHAELQDAPWVLWGHSGGSSWSSQMIVRHPGRVLAASFRGGCSKQFSVPEFRSQFSAVASDLPLLFVWGKRESVPESSHFVSWMPMNTMFRELRAQGGRVCRVIDPRSEHGCDDSRLMSLSFFDAVLSGDTQPGALADIATLEERKVNEANQSDSTLAWLPNANFAKLWREFSETGTLSPVNPTLTAPELAVGRGHEGHTRLSWTLLPEISGGLRALRIHRDGQLWKEIGLKPTDFLATSRDATPEVLRNHEVIDESTEAHTYSLTFLDAGGNESPPSQP